MSLFEGLIKVYDLCSNIAGKENPDPESEVDERKTLLPLFHTTLKTDFLVTLDKDGRLVSIVRDNKTTTIIAACSEDSEARSSNVAAHAHCDQLGYVDKSLEPKKYEVYIAQLLKWKGDNKKLGAIYTYLQNNSVAQDIQRQGLFKPTELDSEGNINVAVASKIGVRFCVWIARDLNANVWLDPQIASQWVDYYLKSADCQEEDVEEIEEGFDYLSGSKITLPATKHPKKINLNTGNAKLLSCNDSAGFTYRGKFENQNQAMLVDAISSQKAHAALKWLIKNTGYSIGTQVMVCFAVSEEPLDVIKPYENSYNTVRQQLDNAGEDNDAFIEAQLKIDNNYAQAMRGALMGTRPANALKTHNNKIIVAIFDAATTGRMGITFYKELARNQYINTIVRWHEHTSWNLLTFKINKDESEKKEQGQVQAIRYIGCPSAFEIISACYGSPKSGNDKSYNLLKKNTFKMLMERMFSAGSVPTSMVRMAVDRVSNPLRFADSENKFSESKWLMALNTTCALIRGDRYYNFMEEISMTLDKHQNNKHYLFGRLLAIADEIESLARYKKDSKKSEKERDKRLTNAFRMMNKFYLNPSSTWKNLYSKLSPYLDEIDKDFYLKEIDEIILALGDDICYNEPLEALFLLGFSSQREEYAERKKAAKQKQKENQKENQNENQNEGE